MTNNQSNLILLQTGNRVFGMVLSHHIVARFFCLGYVYTLLVSTVTFDACVSSVTTVTKRGFRPYGHILSQVRHLNRRFVTSVTLNQYMRISG